jgi:hypothetical protein
MVLVSEFLYPFIRYIRLLVLYPMDLDVLGWSWFLQQSHLWKNDSN